MPIPEVSAKQQSNLDFKMMSLVMKIRDFYRPRIRILEEVDIKTGSRMLDYGCGPGSYLVPLAELIGESGEIYALDANPLAIDAVKRLATKKGLANVRTILSDRETGLSPDSIDIVLLYDILHDLKEPDAVLAELHRILKPGGILSVSDHHLKKDEIISRVTGNGLFRLSVKKESIINFAK